MLSAYFAHILVKDKTIYHFMFSVFDCIVYMYETFN